MIWKKPAPHLDGGVGTSFPLANKRETRLRGDHARSKRYSETMIRSEVIAL